MSEFTEFEQKIKAAAASEKAAVLAWLNARKYWLGALVGVLALGIVIGARL